MEYAKLVTLYDQLGSTSKRLEKTAYLSAFLREAPANLLRDITLLVQGKVFPSWEEKTIGFAAKLVIKAIVTSTGNTEQQFITSWKKTGDLGEAVAIALEKKKQQTLYGHSLSVEKVISNLRKLATLEGGGSVAQKVSLVAELLSFATPKEGQYIVRTVLEELRVGIGEGALRDAIAWANMPPLQYLFVACSTCQNINPAIEQCLWCKTPLTEKSEHKPEDPTLEHIYELPLNQFVQFSNATKARDLYNAIIAVVQHAYDVTNDFGEVASIAKSKGLKALTTLDLAVGKPLKVMLAIKADSIAEALETVGKPADIEYKLDGFRMQIHRKGKSITLYTRRLENVTAQFPDVVEAIKEHIKGDDYILDAEAVGYHPTTNKYKPFQEMSQRIKRKYNVEELIKQLPVELNVFDILWYKQKQTIDMPLKQRLTVLEQLIAPKKGKVVLVPHIITDNEKEIETFYKQSLAAGNEGIMIKNIEAPYKPGARVGHMIKIKPTLDTLDLVIIGAEWGEGKRGKWLSSYILACQDEEGELLTIGKVATGLKEKEEEGVTFAQISALLEPLIIAEKEKEVSLQPKIVIEVTFEEIQKSPSYTSGFALRFPRFKSLREDKPVSEIATHHMVEELFYGQLKRHA